MSSGSRPLEKKRIHVMAAALVDARGRVLLQRRAADAHQGGLWEFPGGKLEKGETREQGLARELEEELGVRPRTMRPLISVAHDYDDRAVRLDVWRVEQWHGEPAALEGQPLAWVHPEDFSRYDFPAADRPVLSALALPELLAISAPIAQLSLWEAQLKNAISKGLSLVQIRSPQHDSNELAQLLAPMLARFAVDAPQVRFLVNAPPAIADRLTIAGVHLTSKRLWQFDTRPLAGAQLLSASCHHAQDLAQAARIAADFAVLGPVQPTTSHPNAVPMGWDGFAALVADAQLPVYALGGLGRDDLAMAHAAGAQGVAAISALWLS